MSAGARRSPAAEMASALRAGPNGAEQAAASLLGLPPLPDVFAAPSAKLRVFVAADNRLLRETLGRMLMRKSNVEVSGLGLDGRFQAESVAQAKADVLLLTSKGTLNDDLLMIQKVRTVAPDARIVLLGMAKNEVEFLQCVRAGISGYLLRDASSEEVVEGVAAVHAGEAVCPRALCSALFRYFESETRLMPCASPKRRLGLTRREQQLVPFIAKGLTNKEIANHFSLSEQTVKNHLYRMKQKTHAEDRLDIVQIYRTQGFLV